jgi:FtsP/CotA-like multicopper oxidase with cupredoxin domain
VKHWQGITKFLSTGQAKGEIEVNRADTTGAKAGAQSGRDAVQMTGGVSYRRALLSISRRNIACKITAPAAAIAISVAAAFLLVGYQPVLAQLGSPDFANPSEVTSRPAEKRLRMVMEMISGVYEIPNVGKVTLRQFRGWDAAQKPPDLTSDTISPGPTLRVRLGDQVQIAFLNKVDDREFSYTFDTVSNAGSAGSSSFGCDKSGMIYPGNDKFPNCFHGSSTGNLHFHGTHTSPDGLGDNVLVEVLPQFNQQDWTDDFKKIFDSGTIPQRWEELPEHYREEQLKLGGLVQQHDDTAAEQAAKNGLKRPESLYDKDMEEIREGRWPQYLIGAFPNFFVVPEYKPGGEYKAGQAPGTHWYHAHKHGSTSLHILNGLAGALVIEDGSEGGYDYAIRSFYGWGSSYGTHEKIMVFQEFDTTQNLERPGADGKGLQQVLVNGKFTPTITMRPGEVQLWRMLNATEGNGPGKLTNQLFTAAMAAGFTFKQTAMDGVQFSPTNYKNQPFLSGSIPNGLALAGANRADLLVQAPKTLGRIPFGNGGAILFYVNVVDGPPTRCKDTHYAAPCFPTEWPEMPAFLKDLPAPGPNDVTNPNTPVKFEWEPGRTTASRNPNPPHFMINGKQYNQEGPHIDQCMPLNALQDWVLENRTNTPHPFHIHTNPFQVLNISTPSVPDRTKGPGADNPLIISKYTPTDNYVWQDVVNLPPAVINPKDGTIIEPGKVTIRQTFVDFTGTFVLHCHILAHEDRGMMQLVRVVPADDYPDGCQKGIPEQH